MIDHDNLEEFCDAANYDMQDISDSGIAFYSALAQESGGPVLEIACGTGRVSIPIARLGFTVTGLDIVPCMIEQARSKSSGLPTRWIVGDGRTFDLGEEYQLIFLTGNAFQCFLNERGSRSAVTTRVCSSKPRRTICVRNAEPTFPSLPDPERAAVCAPRVDRGRARMATLH